ncbi:hypothetical protein SynMITS9220M01_093 [Synechococcus phage SynMITS9220M01]|nr:hypothetical protein SynMITS9220M01_093 [Synechococcus phage SynMITS9220M01]
MSKEELPSIDDYIVDPESLPSVEDYITEEVNTELPSVEDYIEIEEAVQTIEDAEGNTFAEVEDIIPAFPELIRLINDVRKDIPDIPEIKYYDKELESLTEQINQVREEIPEVPEVRYYESEIEAICEQIDLVKQVIEKNAADIPEIKYYDDQINVLEERLAQVNQNIEQLPEPKYYEEDIQSIRIAIQEVQDQIPTFPKWVNEVNEVPDFSWIGKTFSVIDDDFVKVHDAVEGLRGKVEYDLDRIEEHFDKKEFETRTDFNELRESINTRFDTEKEKIWKEIKETSMRMWGHHKEFKDDDRKLKKQILGEYNTLKQTLKKDLKEVNKESVKTDELLLGYFNDLKKEISELPEVKYYDEQIDEVRDEFNDGLKSLKILVEEIKGKQEVLKEEINNRPIQPDPSESNIDPLTPTDQNFATHEDLAKHYKLFINRVQQQLYTIGGGGAGFIKDLDDVSFDSGIGTNKLLIYNGSSWVGIASTAIGNIGIQSGGSIITDGVKTLNFIGVGNTFAVNGTTVDISISGGAGAGGTWGSNSVGVHTDRIVGINTSSAKSGVSLYVIGDAEFTGNVNIAGTLTKEDVTNVDSIGDVIVGGGLSVAGFSTFNNNVNINANISHTGTATLGSSNGIGTVHIGIGTTALLVDGDARVTGILTVGRSSVTIDGVNNRILIGDEDVTISNSSITIGDNVTINATASGINSAPNVLYVAKDGNDSNNGTSIDNAKLTIKSAVSIAQSGTVIKVLSGNYVEANPITLPAFTAVVGDDLRTVKVLPNTTTSDIFHVNKGCKLANMTFSGHVAPAAAVAFPTGIATNVGGGKWKGPYIQNCTSDTTTGTGIYIDGNLAVKTKSMNVDAFTQYNQGGVGVAVTNEGYAQLVSVFTICCDKAITVHKGAQADLANSNCSFGTLGLVADGVSPEQFTGIVTSSAAAAQDNVTINVGAVTTRPYDGQVVYFDQLYKSVETISVGSGGTGYTQAPTVTIDAPTGPSGETASAFASIENGSVTEISIISSGSQYTGTPTITISGPQSGINTATATANMADTYYTINSATPIVSGITTLTLAENLINTVGVGSTAYFFQQSKIVASSHTFEYIGSGNTITSATPKRGGVTIQANEVVSQNGGRVIYTSTDQAGNFRIGDDLQINQATGTISGRAFSKSLFSEITPFILALS